MGKNSMGKKVKVYLIQLILLVLWINSLFLNEKFTYVYMGLGILNCIFFYFSLKATKEIVDNFRELINFNTNLQSQKYEQLINKVDEVTVKNLAKLDENQVGIRNLFEELNNNLNELNSKSLQKLDTLEDNYIKVTENASNKIKEQIKKSSTYEVESLKKASEEINTIITDLSLTVKILEEKEEAFIKEILASLENRITKEIKTLTQYTINNEAITKEENNKIITTLTENNNMIIENENNKYKELIQCINSKYSDLIELNNKDALRTDEKLESIVQTIVYGSDLIKYTISSNINTLREIIDINIHKSSELVNDVEECINDKVESIIEQIKISTGVNKEIKDRIEIYSTNIINQIMSAIDIGEDINKKCQSIVTEIGSVANETRNVANKIDEESKIIIDNIVLSKDLLRTTTEDINKSCQSIISELGNTRNETINVGSKIDSQSKEVIKVISNVDNSIKAVETCIDENIESIIREIKSVTYINNDIKEKVDKYSLNIINEIISSKTLNNEALVSIESKCSNVIEEIVLSKNVTIKSIENMVQQLEISIKSINSISDIISQVSSKLENNYINVANKLMTSSNATKKIVEDINIIVKLLQSNPGRALDEVAITTEKATNETKVVEDESGTRFFKGNKLIGHKDNEGNITEFKYKGDKVSETLIKNKSGIVNQSYFKDGILSEAKHYKNNKVHAHYFYYPSQELKKVVTYEKDKVSTIEYSQNGKITSKY